MAGIHAGASCDRVAVWGGVGGECSPLLGLSVFGLCEMGDKQADCGDSQFLIHLGVPYCELYDHGYTSLGGTTDTHPNPALKGVGEGGEVAYRPAHELEDDDQERLGRDR